MILNINFLQFLRSRLPAHKQQQNRLALFSLPFKELAGIWSSYKKFRDDALIEANINHSLAAIEWWLNYKLNTGTQITIIENEVNENFVELANRDEGTDFVEVANRDEDTDFIELANRGEPGISISTDFAVRCPVGTDTDKITEIIEQHRAAGTTWSITELPEQLGVL